MNRTAQTRKIVNATRLIGERYTHTAEYWKETFHCCCNSEIMKEKLCFLQTNTKMVYIRRNYHFGRFPHTVINRLHVYYRDCAENLKIGSHAGISERRISKRRNSINFSRDFLVLKSKFHIYWNLYDLSLVNSKYYERKNRWNTKDKINKNNCMNLTIMIWTNKILVNMELTDY